MDNRTCTVVIIPQENQSKPPEVNTLCHNFLYDYFVWSQLHNNNGSRTGSQEYKEHSMKQMHVYFIFRHCPITDGCVVFNTTNQKVGKVTKIHRNADLTIKYGKDNTAVVSIHEVIPVIAATDKSINVATIPHHFITDVLIRAKGKIETVVVDMDTYEKGQDINIISARMFGAEPRPNGNSGNDVSGAPRFIKSHMEVTAKELQAAKIDAELSIMEILQDFNDLCVANDFQLEGLVLNTQETDQDRVFDVDILIL